MIIGETKYKRPDNCESKKKALGLMYESVEWFAGNYVVIDNGALKIVGDSGFFLRSLKRINKLIGIDDMLLAITNDEIVVFDEYLDVVHSIKGQIKVFGCGKIYGYTYISYGASKELGVYLCVLNKHKKNILPTGTLWNGQWMRTENGYETPVYNFENALNELIHEVSCNVSSKVELKNNGEAKVAELSGADLGDIKITVRQIRAIDGHKCYELDIKTPSVNFKEVAFRLRRLKLDGKNIIEVAGFEHNKRDDFLMGRINTDFIFYEQAVGILSSEGMVAPLNQRYLLFENLTYHSLEMQTREDRGIVIVDSEFKVVIGVDVLYPWYRPIPSSSIYPVVKKHDDHKAYICIGGIGAGMVVDRGYERSDFKTIIKTRYISVQIYKKDEFIKQVSIARTEPRTRDELIAHFDILRNKLLNWKSKAGKTKLIDMEV